MARDTTDDTEIENVAVLADYLAQGCKPAEQWRVGTEHEKFPFYVQDLRPVPYDGERGIRALLEGMQRQLQWEPLLDEGRLIGLAEPQGRGAISLEPGGQFELSGAPLADVHETAAEVAAHFSHLHKVAGPLGIGFLGMGASPLWTLEETPVMPKSRYKIMTGYMPKVGISGLDMMYRTATIQVNLDFASETDMRRKMQVAMKLQSVATALFACSPFTEGKPNGFLSWRSQIWRDTDNDRAGVLPFVFSSDFGFADYAEWALDVPMYFVLRDGHYHDVTDITFRQFMDGALKGRIKQSCPTMGDWVNHISTLFPEVRLKRFLEMRGADDGSRAHISALSAYWVGLLYDTAALDAAESLTRDWRLNEVQTLRDNVPVHALQTPFRNTTVLEIARETLKIARMGLHNRACLNSAGKDETHYLDVLDAVVDKGRTQAEVMLADYQQRWHDSVLPVFKDYAL